MRTLSAALSAALGAPVQRPALLVQVEFSTSQRWSSYQTMTWDSRTWAAADVDVRELVVGAYELSGQLLLGNHDDVAGALVLSEGITDRGITIYGYDAGAPTEVVWLANAIGGRASVEPNRVLIDLRHPCDGRLSPRTAINATSFGPGLPDGAILTINNQVVRLDRRN